MVVKNFIRLNWVEEFVGNDPKLNSIFSILEEKSLNRTSVTIELYIYSDSPSASLIDCELIFSNDGIEIENKLSAVYIEHNQIDEIRFRGKGIVIDCNDSRYLIY